MTAPYFFISRVLGVSCYFIPHMLQFNRRFSGSIEVARFHYMVLSPLCEQVRGKMEKIATVLPGVYILEPKVFGDHRGWFMETYSAPDFEPLGLQTAFVQDNHSFTAQRGTLRGMHFQQDPMSQLKVVRVVRGGVLDVAVDLRKGSPTYLKWVGVELTAENKRMLYIPRGFAHGFLTLTDDVEFVYKVDNPYSQLYDRSIRFDDPAIHVNWGIDAPILSNKDQNAPLLKDSDCNFVYEG